MRPREPPDRDSSAPPVKRTRPAVVPPSPVQATNNRHSSSYKQDEEDDIQEVMPVKSEPREPNPPNTAVTPVDSSYQEDRADQSGSGGQLVLDETYQEDSYDYGDYGEGYDDNSGIIGRSPCLCVLVPEILLFRLCSSGGKTKSPG